MVRAARRRSAFARNIHLGLNSMRSFLIVLSALAIVSTANAQPPANPGITCKSGIPCGNTCIAKGQVCHVRRQSGPTCRSGRTKPCGLTCIPIRNTCHHQ